jgi:universal stress protein A
VIVAAVPFQPLAARGPSPVVDPLEEEERSKLLEEAIGLTGDHAFKTRALELHGDPAEAIVAAAKDSGAELIIVGKHGRHGALAALLGSTAEHVVRHAPCDVLVVQ